MRYAASRRRRRAPRSPHQGWRLLAGGLGLGVVVLIPTIGRLAATIPQSFSTRAWATAWVCYDLALLVLFALTALAVLRRHLFAIPGLFVAAAFLAGDAWFDVICSWGTPEQAGALRDACVSVPFSVVLAIFGWRSLRRLVAAARPDAATGRATETETTSSPSA